MIHDDGLERTTNGRGPVRERTVRELKRLDAGRWFAWRFRGQRVQTLREVLERFRDRTRFVVALQEGSDVRPGIEERLLGLLNLYGVAERSLVASFDHHALRRCRALDHSVPLGARVVGRLLDPGALAPSGILTALCLDASQALEPDVGPGGPRGSRLPGRDRDGGRRPPSGCLAPGGARHDGGVRRLTARAARRPRTTRECPRARAPRGWPRARRRESA